MLNTISWQSYCTAIAILSGFYYGAIILLYYRQDIKALLEGREVVSLGGVNIADEEFEPPSSESNEGIIYSCMDELNAFFEEAKKRKWQQHEMIYALQRIFKKYPSIKSSEYKQSVQNAVANQCEHICGIHFNKEELNTVWLG